ncbi:MAG: hypothetical protein LIP77_11205 [Planctomycetes bacterium]|nr:hypothetical protein [Planctomycetota bacterium]
MATEPSPAAEDDLRRFQEQEIGPLIPQADRLRAGAAHRAFLAAAAVFVLLLAGFSSVPWAFRRPDGEGTIWFSVILFAAALAGVAHHWLRRRFQRQAEETTRALLFSRLATRLGPGIGYDARRRLEDEAGQAGLFDTAGAQYDRRAAAGAFYGEAAGAAFAFAPAWTERAAPHGCRIRRGIRFSGFLGLVAEEPSEQPLSILTYPKAEGMTAAAAAARLDPSTRLHRRRRAVRAESAKMDQPTGEASEQAKGSERSRTNAFVPTATGCPEVDDRFATFAAGTATEEALADHGARMAFLIKEWEPWTDGLALSRTPGTTGFAVTTGQPFAALPAVECVRDFATFRAFMAGLTHCRRSVAALAAPRADGSHSDG